MCLIEVLSYVCVYIQRSPQALSVNHQQTNLCVRVYLCNSLENDVMSLGYGVSIQNRSQTYTFQRVDEMCINVHKKLYYFIYKTYLFRVGRTFWLFLAKMMGGISVVTNTKARMPMCCAVLCCVLKIPCLNELVFANCFGSIKMSRLLKKCYNYRRTMYGVNEFHSNEMAWKKKQKRKNWHCKHRWNNEINYFEKVFVFH